MFMSTFPHFSTKPGQLVHFQRLQSHLISRGSNLSHSCSSVIKASAFPSSLIFCVTLSSTQSLPPLLYNSQCFSGGFQTCTYSKSGHFPEGAVCENVNQCPQIGVPDIFWNVSCQYTSKPSPKIFWKCSYCGEQSDWDNLLLRSSKVNGKLQKVSVTLNFLHSFCKFTSENSLCDPGSSGHWFLRLSRPVSSARYRPTPTQVFGGCDATGAEIE